MAYYDDWDKQEAMIGQELARREQTVDLDPHRTATYLEHEVPYCYLGHADCYDRHEAERRADEADWEHDRE